MANPLEIRCAACKRVTLARAEPVYEDFKKVAEAFVCTACGYRYPSREKTPFVEAAGRPRVFSDADKPAAVKVFQAGERRRTCGWCRHFIVNPFLQRCGLNNREIEATDVCARFSFRPEKATDAAAAPPASAAAKRFDALFGPGIPAAPPGAPPVAEPPPAVKPPPVASPVAKPPPVAKPASAAKSRAAAKTGRKKK